MKQFAVVISCEHAVDLVPAPYAALFKGYDHLLATHRGIDFGALAIAKHVHQVCQSDFIAAKATRLLIDCNRSLHHPQCFSEVTQHLDAPLKQQIISQYYLPFRQQVLADIMKHISDGLTVWHLSIHSFTPVMDGRTRNADIGLLYDPRRSAEKEFAAQWKQAIKQLHPQYKVRLNYPYRGTSDGLTSFLRKQFLNNQYIGIEVETNQALTKDVQMMHTIKHILSESLQNLMS